jgi:TrwC relaxase
LAVVVTVAKGYDLDYIWKTQEQASGARTPGGYYINAAQAGEPPGRWWGPGAQALGFASGQIVERKPYDAVYQQRDPRTGARLGRPRGRYARFADHLDRLKAAEPHATAERVIELEREAAQVTRQPAVYTDVTVSFSKSISVLHASIRENARRARLAGDDRAMGRHARRPPGGHRGHGVERARPGRHRTSSRRWPGDGGSAVARGAGPGGAEGAGAGVGEAAGLDPARPGQAAGLGDAG